MNYKVLVYATQNWKTRKQKHARIAKLMMAGGAFDEVTFDTVLWTGGKPDMKGDRIDFDWFENNLSGPAKVKGYNHALFSFSMAERRRWGLYSGVRGSNAKDQDFFGESWVRSDENSITRFKDGTKRDRYEKTVPHEIGHELKNQGLTPLLIHDYDYTDTINKIEQFYLKLKLSSELPVLKGRIADLENLKKKLTKAQELTVPFPQWSKPSQAYGVANISWYPLTGHHIGTDFPTPVGTAIQAPADCEVTRSGNLPRSLGYWCEVKVGTFYIVFAHMKAQAVPGIYKKNWVIGWTGATGFIKGVHTHVEGWTIPMDRAKLNKGNWQQLTFDIMTKIKSQ